MNSPAPGWLPDPTSRHEYRYWDGSGWTDDVADRGVTSTDPVAGPPPAPGPFPSAAPGPSEPDPTVRADQTMQQPTVPSGPGGPGGPGPVLPGGTAYGAPPPSGPAPRKRLSPGLVAALAVVAVALIGGLAFLLTRDDDDSPDTDEISAEDETTTTEPDEDSGDGERDDQFLVDMMAQGMEEAAGGAITHEQAVCASEGIIDEFGLSDLMERADDFASDPFSDPEMASAVLEIFDDCGVSPEVLAEVGAGG